MFLKIKSSLPISAGYGLNVTVDTLTYVEVNQYYDRGHVSCPPTQLLFL